MKESVFSSNDGHGTHQIIKFRRHSLLSMLRSYIPMLGQSKSSLKN